MAVGFRQDLIKPIPENICRLQYAVYRQLYPFFDKTFIADSFSCRIGKGTHKALNRFCKFGCKVSKNNARTRWILKCDIRKFFENIDHSILLGAMLEHSGDGEIVWLLSEIIGSFNSKRLGVGLPLGNLTSQLFVNIYINKFDQFVKHKPKTKFYIRYADDFAVFSEDRKYLESLIPKIREFLNNELWLELHPHKISIKTLASGVDFLGWTYFPDHRVLRTATKRRMLKRIKRGSKAEAINSYLGLLKHGNVHKIKSKVANF